MAASQFQVRSPSMTEVHYAMFTTTGSLVFQNCSHLSLQLHMTSAALRTFKSCSKTITAIVAINIRRAFRGSKSNRRATLNSAKIGLYTDVRNILTSGVLWCLESTVGFFQPLEMHLSSLCQRVMTKGSSKNLRSSKLRKNSRPLNVEIMYTPLTTTIITNQSVIAFTSRESSRKNDTIQPIHYAQTTHNFNKTLMEMQPILTSRSAIADKPRCNVGNLSQK